MEKRGSTIESDFAIVDVKRGRAKLATLIGKGGKLRVLLEIELDTQHSKDDGVSTEFSGSVLSITAVS